VEKEYLVQAKIAGRYLFPIENRWVGVVCIKDKLGHYIPIAPELLDMGAPEGYDLYPDSAICL
jgi:hypothetical protein